MSSAAFYYPTKEINDLRALLIAAERQFGLNVLFRLPGADSAEDVSYSAFYGAVEAFGSYLCGSVKPGITALLVADNSFEWACAFFTVVSGLGKAVPAGSALSAEEISAVAAKTGADYVFYSEKYLEKIQGIPGTHVCLDSMAAFCEEGRAKLDSGKDDFISLPVSENDVALVLCQTPDSKPFALTHGDLCSDVCALAGMILTDGKDVIASPLPWTRQYPLTVSLLFPMIRGSSTVICRGMRNLTRDLKESGATVLCSTPSLTSAIYRGIQNNIAAKGAKKARSASFLAGVSGKFVKLKKRLFSELHDSFGGRLRFIINSGACDSGVEDGLFGYGLPVISCFGMGGGLPLVTVSREDALRSGSCGIPAPGTVADVYDARTDGCGEIRFKSEALACAADSSGRKGLLRGQWIYTGLMGRIDRDGFLFINGRKSNIIELPGARIIPENAEKILESNRFVKRAALLAIRNENSGDTDLVAVLAPDTAALRKEYGPRYTKGQTDAEMSAAVASADAAGPEQQRIRCYVIMEGLGAEDKLSAESRARLAGKIRGEYLRKLAKAD